MAYWISDDTVICPTFPTSLGGFSIEIVRQVTWGQIDSFRELAEQFADRFITNSRVVKGPDVLTHLRNEKNETLRDYSSRYWEVFQEAEDCDLKFAISKVWIAVGQRWHLQ